MQLISFSSVAVILALGGAAAENAKFCTQDEKERANSLHEQNRNPAKSCYRAANGDITTLATSRLCPLPECVTWLDYMAANAPDCFFDSKNYATIYAAKSAECTGGSSASGSANLRSSSSGSETSSSLANRTASSTDDSSNLSAMSEDRELNTTSSLSASTTGDVSDVGESSKLSMESASSNGETDETNAATPTPTEDLKIEGQSASTATDSSNNTRPIPTTSASSSLSMISPFIALISVVVSVVIEFM